MSKHTFNDNQIKQLKQNENVVRVTEKTIVFTDEFKIKLVRSCNRS